MAPREFRHATKKSAATRKASAGSGRNAVRSQVRQLLEAAPGYRSLAPDRRRQIAHDTARVAAYLVDPDRLVSQEFARGVLTSNELLAAVDFPAFVSGLIQGVFGAIVNASARQMEAYARLVAHAASSVAHFAADDITESKARAQLAQRFPHLLCIAGKNRLEPATVAAPRSAITQMARTLGLRRPWPALDTPGGRRILVVAMRRHMARERQKSLALALAMGINRIVVTQGRIAARVDR